MTTTQVKAMSNVYGKTEGVTPVKPAPEGTYTYGAWTRGKITARMLLQQMLEELPDYVLDSEVSSVTSSYNSMENSRASREDDKTWDFTAWKVKVFTGNNSE